MCGEIFYMYFLWQDSLEEDLYESTLYTVFPEDMLVLRFLLPA